MVNETDNPSTVTMPRGNHRALRRPAEPRLETRRSHDIMIGEIITVQAAAQVLVAVESIQTDVMLVSHSLVAISATDVGRHVALMFENADTASPVIMGFVHRADPEPAASRNTVRRSLKVHLSDDRLSVTAEREIVLECGKASITLTRAGKVIIRGTYILTRSSGANRIKGGVVEIN